jgi:hypothetical protein
VCTCDPPCALANATASCIASRCEIAACDVGYADCDRMTPTGCETNLTADDLNCGRCNARCRSGTRCAMAMCR